MIIAVQMFLENPILGVGKRNYQALYVEYSSMLGLDPRLEDRQAHSLYLELAAEMGMLGLLSFGGILLALFLSTARAPSVPRSGSS
jgi:O-antigen ligase